MSCQKKDISNLGDFLSPDVSLSVLRAPHGIAQAARSTPPHLRISMLGVAERRAEHLAGCSMLDVET